MSAATLNKVVAYVRRLSDTEVRGLTDRQLLARFTAARDESAFAELVRRHGPMVLATCRRVLRHEQDAEDAFQAAFLVLARKASSIRRHDSVAGWLYQVAHRIAARAGMIAARRVARFSPLVGEPARPDPGDLEATLAEELALMPEQYRAAIVLCYLEGKTQTEAASLLATTADAVNSRLKRARDLLRHRLARQGVILSATALTHAIASESAHALPPVLIGQTAHVAARFAIHSGTTTGASALAVALAQGALQEMIPAPLKILSALVVVLAMLTSGTLLLPSSAKEDAAPRHEAIAVAEQEPKAVPKEPAKKPRQCIVLWMSGGPSQIDTFDPKAGNIAMFKSIPTTVKEMQFAETVPQLARQAKHLAVLRGVSHREGDHARGTYLMHTGFAAGGADYPAFGCVLAKELWDGKRDAPRFISLNPGPAFLGRTGPGILGVKYTPIDASGKSGEAPPLEAYEAIDLGKDKAAATHKAMTKAFDLDGEKADLRDAYGRGTFGTSCLLARRLIEAGVPVVEVNMGGWDTHANAQAATTKLCGELDAGMGSLIKDLQERKLLEHTLVVWMGEFGRTPRINLQKGRDHWPLSFTVVLAGAGIKGGQVIGKTSADSLKIEEGAVSPQELLATIYQAVGVDASKKNKAPGGQDIPLVEKGNSAVKQALR